MVPGEGEDAEEVEAACPWCSGGNKSYVYMMAVQNTFLFYSLSISKLENFINCSLCISPISLFSEMFYLVFFSITKTMHVHTFGYTLIYTKLVFVLIIFKV